MQDSAGNQLKEDSRAGSIDLTPLKASETSLMEVSRNRKNDATTLQYTTNDVGLAKSRTIMPNALNSKERRNVTETNANFDTID